LSLLLVVLAPSFVGAQLPTADERARSAFEAGSQAYARGAFAEALAQFELAYTLSARPALLYNIARAADAEGHYGRALQAYEAFEASSASADNRDFVRARIARLRAAPSGPPAAPAVTPVPLPPAAPLPTVASSLSETSPSAPAQISPQADATAASKPLWKRGWLWGTVVGVASVAAVGVALALRNPAPERASADAYVIAPEVP
jgi:tetratricopeptide (TPR) repeat protein